MIPPSCGMSVCMVTHSHKEVRYDRMTWYLVLGKHKKMDGWAQQAVHAANPESAVKDASMTRFERLKVYVLMDEPHGKPWKFEEGDLDL